MSDFPNLFSLARSKLQLSVGGKDGCSLHRWVLLKNSIVQPTSAPCSQFLADSTHTSSLTDDADEDISVEEVDSFMFPDAGKLVGGSAVVESASEAQWLNSLLEQLGDEDDDDFVVESDTSLTLTPADEDDDQFFFSPTASPLSSTDDLPSQPSYYSPSFVSYPYPYLVPYPPSQSALAHAYEELDSSLDSLPAPSDDPLPYYELAESESPSVPDAIEDTSDDESDAPRTPSIGRSATSFAIVDAVSLSPPTGSSGLQHLVTDVHVDGHNPFFYPLEFDPLPFSEHHRAYNIFAEC